MSINLLTQLTEAFRGDATDRVASALGETPARTQSALGAAIPALIGAFAMKTTSLDQASGFLDMMTRNKFDSGTFTDVSGAVKAPDGINNVITAGRPFIESFFGGRSAGVSDWVAATSGVSRSSSSAILNLALPIVLGYVAKALRSTEWSAASLLKLFGEQKAFLKDAPAGLAQVLGDYDLPTSGIAESDTGRREQVSAYAAPSRRSAWLWAIPLLLLIPLLGYFMSRDDKPGREASVGTMSAPERKADKADPKSRQQAGKAETRPRQQARTAEPLTVPDGEKPVGTSSVPTAPARIGEYRLQFQTGSNALTAESAAKLRTVIEELKAQPRTKIEITGHTDYTGNEAANVQLSQARAAAVRDRLADMGVDKARVTVKGFGGSQPIGDNSTAEGRKHNRRVDIVVTGQ